VATRSSIFALFILVLALLVPAGCGDDDDNATGSANGSASNGSPTDDSSGGGSTTGEGPDGGESEGGDGSADAGSSTPERAEFIKEADALCLRKGKDILDEIAEIAAPEGVDQATPAVLEQIVEDALAPSLEAEIRELRALGPPAEDREEVEAVFAAIQTQVDRAREDPITFVAEGNPFEESQAVAREYGLKICGGIAPRPKQPGS
jgi:hypothetical protein